MSTPAERAVIAAARSWAASTGEDGAAGRLRFALDALDAEQGSAAEMEITWGQLVADDELWSAKAGKWFTVLEVKHVPTPGNDVGATQIRLQGVGNPFKNPSNVTARVRRSAMGKAVDMFATVLWSGPNGG